MPQTGNPLAFLIETVVHLYLVALLLRFLLQAVRANFYNPVSHMLVRVTDPVLRPLRRVVPGVGGIDVAALVAMFAIQMLGLWLVLLIVGRSVSLGWLMALSLYNLIDLALLTLIVTIVVQAIISWVSPGAGHPAASLLRQVNEPVLGPFRRMLPMAGGLDLSPLFALIALQFLRLLLRSIWQWLL
ncbi:MAG: YggT family protein [Xanthomonadaceae bacterium]|nr:YggT family protein [Xanthomonadaceae bacterium]